MPERDLLGQSFKYPMGEMGVNFYKNIVELNPKECLKAQNLIWRNGMVKRNGSSKFETDEVVASKKIVGLHRFYYSTNSKQLLATAGTIMKYHDGATWQNAKTGLTDSTPATFATWGTLNKVYVANGTDTPFSWDGSSASNLSGTNFPATAIQFLAFRDRLLHIDNTNPGRLGWSASYSDTAWEALSDIGLRPDSKLHGMVLHADSNKNVGLEAKVLLAGSSDMYLFSGIDLDPASAGADFKLDGLGLGVGCTAPKTMSWTPKGTIWLGVNKQVYILPFNSNTPIPIGHKITSTRTGVEGLNDLPANQMSNAAGAYHDGFYILSVAGSSSSVNNRQYWLDVDRLRVDEEGYFGPWYGPMIGQNISVFARQNGPGDSGELLGGESNAATGGFVYSLDQKGVHSDVSSAILTRYQTYYHDLGDADFRKEVRKIEAELLDTSGTVNVEFHDITGAVKTGDSFALTGSASYWDEDYYDEIYYSSSAPARQVVNIDPSVYVRRLSIIITQNTANDTFELYSLKAKAVQESLVFD